jgi:transcriptional regulator with XRE-family HTH domain
MQSKTGNSANNPYTAAMPGGRPATKPAPKFGARLAALRSERGLSQNELAASLHTTRSAIVYYERAAGNPSADFIQKAAEFFGVTANDLLGVTPSKAKAKPGPTSELQQLTEELGRLPRAQQKMVAQMLRGVLAQAKAA